jgi:hypothetical protein
VFEGRKLAFSGLALVAFGIVCVPLLEDIEGNRAGVGPTWVWIMIGALLFVVGMGVHRRWWG